MAYPGRTPLHSVLTVSAAHALRGASAGRAAVGGEVGAAGGAQGHAAEGGGGRQHAVRRVRLGPRARVPAVGAAGGQHAPEQRAAADAGADAHALAGRTARRALREDG